MRVLLIEDEARISDFIVAGLSARGVDVQVCNDRNAGFDQARRGAHDAIVLDLMLPGIDGLEICRRARAVTRHTPIIITSARGSEVHRILGLEMGADDYLAKPFNPRELLARVNAVLRRRQASEAPGAPAMESGEVQFGEFVLNLGTRVLARNGEPLPLTSGEFAVLKVFAQHPKVALSREKLMVLARGREYGAYDRSLDVQISRLRKLIEVDPQKPRYLQTVWGVGYVFIPDGQ